MPLPDADCGGKEENILTTSNGGTWLFNLEFNHFTRVENNLGNIGRAAASELSVQSFERVNDTTSDKPPPEIASQGTHWTRIGFDEAVCSMGE